MKYEAIQYVKNPVSRIIFGTAIAPINTGLGGDELLEAAFENGINTFDTARNYSMAEKTLGRWLQETGLRNQVNILSKCGHPLEDGLPRLNSKAMWEDLEVSCELLGTEYIDLYLTHRDDPAIPAGKVVEVFNEMHQKKRIGAFGVSNWSYQRIQEANQYAEKNGLIPLTISSPNFSLARQVNDPWGGGCVSISGPENEEARAWYCKNNIPVIAYSSLGRGLLSGRVKSSDWNQIETRLDPPAVKGYVSKDNFERLRRCEILAQQKQVPVSNLALAWLFHQSVNVFPVVSSTNPQRMKNNLESLNIVLTDEEAEFLYNV